MNNERSLRQLAQAAVEAMLFAAPGPLTIEEMAKAADMPESAVRSALTHLADQYQADGRGINLMHLGQGYQLLSRAEFCTIIERLGRHRHLPGLSRAALETLTVIAYRQPITRAEIEALRGVRSDGTLSTLLERDLIRESGRKDTVGKPILYATTQGFLIQFGLGTLAELPPLPEDISNEDE